MWFSSMLKISSRSPAKIPAKNEIRGRRQYLKIIIATVLCVCEVRKRNFRFERMCHTACVYYLDFRSHYLVRLCNRALSYKNSVKKRLRYIIIGYEINYRNFFLQYSYSEGHRCKDLRNNENVNICWKPTLQVCEKQSRPLVPTTLDKRMLAWSEERWCRTTRPTRS